MVNDAVNIHYISVQILISNTKNIRGPGIEAWTPGMYIGLFSLSTILILFRGLSQNYGSLKL